MLVSRFYSSDLICIISKLEKDLASAGDFSTYPETPNMENLWVFFCNVRMMFIMKKILT